jgi:hypothetical protein
MDGWPGCREANKRVAPGVEEAQGNLELLFVMVGEFGSFLEFPAGLIK